MVRRGGGRVPAGVRLALGEDVVLLRGPPDLPGGAGETGFWDRLPSLQPPSLFVWGQQDRLVPAKFAPRVERALPAATSVVLPDCGHVPQFELPEKTNALIREFIGVGAAA